MSLAILRNNIINWIKSYGFVLIVALLSLTTALPQIHNQSIIIGVDALFHFNRFYDVAEQIKHLSFSYFISPFASLSVGRMVNSIYGSFGAIFNGILLLIAGSYLRYQIISRVALSLIAMLSMYYALRQSGVDKNTSQVVSIVYPFTYQVIMWNVTQAFTAWGAALMPLGIMLGIRMVKQTSNPINSLQMAFIMSLIVQTHLVTALQVVIVLTIYAGFGFARSKNRMHFILSLLQSIGLFLCLCANVIAGFIELYVGNHVAGLAKISNPNARTLNILNLSHTEYSILIILFISIIIFITNWSITQLETKITASLSIFFYLLAMPILPWNALFDHSSIIAIIQFPSRFIAIGTALILIADAQIISNQHFHKNWALFLKGGLITLGVLMVSANYYSTNQHSNRIFSIPKSVLPIRSHSVREHKQAKHLFATKDLSKPLAFETKATPDYLPLQVKSTRTNNSLYQEFDSISFHQASSLPVLSKSVTGSKITITWLDKYNRNFILPAAFYSRTKASFNGRKYNFHGNSHSKLKFPIVNSQVGKNKFTFNYYPRFVSKFLVVLALLSWLATMIFFIYSLLKHRLTSTIN